MLNEDRMRDAANGVRSLNCNEALVHLAQSRAILDFLKARSAKEKNIKPLVVNVGNEIEDGAEALDVLWLLVTKAPQPKEVSMAVEGFFLAAVECWKSVVAKAIDHPACSKRQFGELVIRGLKILNRHALWRMALQCEIDQRWIDARLFMLRARAGRLGNEPEFKVSDWSSLDKKSRYPGILCETTADHTVMNFGEEVIRSMLIETAMGQLNDPAEVDDLEEIIDCLLPEITQRNNALAGMYMYINEETGRSSWSVANLGGIGGLGGVCLSPQDICQALLKSMNKGRITVRKGHYQRNPDEVLPACWMGLDRHRH